MFNHSDVMSRVREMSLTELENWILLNYAGASYDDTIKIEEIQFLCRQEIQRRDIESGEPS